MSLAEKLAALITPEPGFQDPEQDVDTTAAKVVDFNAETDITETDYLSGGVGDKSQPSKLRRQNASLDGEDQRYSGKKTSRKELAKLQKGLDSDEETGADYREHAAAELGHMFEGFDSDEEEGTEGDSGDDEGTEGDSGDDEELSGEENVEFEEDLDENEDMEAETKDDNDQTNTAQQFVFDSSDQDFGKFGDVDEENESDDKQDSDEDSGDELGEDLTAKDEVSSGSDSDDDAEIFNNSSVEGEVGKGKAVTHQLKTWDKLLELRIQQQKMLTKVNRLPVDGYWEKLIAASPNDLNMVVNETQSALKALQNAIQYLDAILAQGPDCEPPAKKKKLSGFSSAIEESHNNFKHERNDTIQKWNDKTRITSGGKNSFVSMETSTVQQIEQIMSNPSRLIQRTRLKRTQYTALGREDVQEDESLTETDVNIFDDGDFYHQLLKDLIERKTSATTDGAQLTQQWLEVQKLRSKLKKRKIDTKASKGKKIRYDIHTRMVNFMAPVYNDSASKEQSINQLFASLFGNRKS